MNMVEDCSVFNLDELEVHQSYDANGQPDRDIVAGDYVRHFKGHIYKVVTIAEETETGIPYVIYDAMTNGPRKSWARPYYMFMSEVDHMKYPDAKQKYRLEKVWLSKKVNNAGIDSIEYTQDNEIIITKKIREFFSRCDISRHERMQVWQAIERPVNVNEARPTINRLFMNTKVNVKVSYHGSRTMVLTTPGVRTTIHEGDVLHFLENRMVLEDRKCREHDFFEIVPDIME